METAVKLKTSSNTGRYLVRDLSIPFSEVEVHFEEERSILFPRTGYLIVNLYMGSDYSCCVNQGKIATTNRLYVTGLSSQGALNVKQKGSCKGYAIKLHPVIGYYFLKVPMYELVDRQVEVSTVLNGSAKLLRQVEENEEISSLYNKYLTLFLKESLPERNTYLKDPIYHAVNKIREVHGCIRVKKLASEFCMGLRTLNRQFLLKVGLPVQAYCKIWQLDYAIGLIRKHPSTSFSEIAFKAGFYDVAHLAHDFKRMVFLNPSAFRGKIPTLASDYLSARGFS